MKREANTWVSERGGGFKGKRVSVVVWGDASGEHEAKESNGFCRVFAVSVASD